MKCGTSDSSISLKCQKKVNWKFHFSSVVLDIVVNAINRLWQFVICSKYSHYIQHWLYLLVDLSKRQTHFHRNYNKTNQVQSFLNKLFDNSNLSKRKNI
jgi:hypothetical protein